MHEHIITDGAVEMFGKSNFTRGHPSGEAKYYYNSLDSGKLAQIRYFDTENNNYRNAYVKKYYPSGKLNFHMTYTDGGNVDRVIIYNEDGNIRSIKEYKDGKLIEE